MSFVATVVMIVVVGAMVGWYAAKYFTGRLAESDSALVRIPESGAPTNTDEKPPQRKEAPPAEIAAAERTGAAAPQDTAPTPGAGTKQTAPKKASAAAPLNPVNSYPTALSYDISAWTVGKNPSGFLDSAKFGNRALGQKNPTPLGAFGVVELSGWAGDGGVGIRYPYVLISVCGKIVAHGEVDTPRPDVARAVHANLERSGWRVRVALQHLPSCENMALRAWGVAPGDRHLILPLNGKIPISILRAGQKPEQLALRPPEKSLRPADMKGLPPVTLKVTADALNIRKCAGPGCPVIGKLAKGDWTVLLLDESNGWLLVAMPDRAGWISKKFANFAHRPG